MPIAYIHTFKAGLIFVNLNTPPPDLGSQTQKSVYIRDKVTQIGQSVPEKGKIPHSYS